MNLAQNVVRFNADCVMAYPYLKMVNVVYRYTYTHVREGTDPTRTPQNFSYVMIFILGKKI